MKKKAFTLIELLVVIAIIAILAAILFPVFAQAKQAAKKSSDLSNMKQINTAIQMYLGDADDVYPQAYYYNNDNNSANGYTQWSGTVSPYVKNLQIFVSPLDPNRGLAPTNFVGNNRGFGYPSGQTSQYPLQDNQAPRLSYIANSLVMPRKRRSADPMNVIGAGVVDEPASTITVATMTFSPTCINDSSSASGTAFKTHRSMNSIKLASGSRFAGEDPAEINNAFYYTVTPQEAAARWASCKLSTDSTADAMKFHIGYIQSDSAAGGANYSFGDGHSKFLKPSTTLNPTNYLWGKRCYTCGGGEIRDPITGNPVN